jgi:hypothetical protein
MHPMDNVRNPTTLWTGCPPGNLLLILFIITSPYEEYNCVLIVLKGKEVDTIISALRQQILYTWARDNENRYVGHSTKYKTDTMF